MTRHMVCKVCGPVGFEDVIGGKQCNNCGLVKKRNKRAPRTAPTSEFLAWLDSQ